MYVTRLKQCNNLRVGKSSRKGTSNFYVPVQHTIRISEFILELGIEAIQSE